MPIVVGINGNASLVPAGGGIEFGNGLSRMERVTADPRDSPGLDRPIGSVALYASGVVSTLLVKQTTNVYGWREASEPAGMLLPETHTRFGLLTGLTPTVYFNQFHDRAALAAALVPDRVGGTGLTRTGTTLTAAVPYLIEGRGGMWFNSAAAASCDADVANPANTSFIAICQAAVLDPSLGNVGLMGRTNGSGKGWNLWFAAGSLVLAVDDNAGNTFTSAVTGAPDMGVTKQRYCVGVQRDKGLAKWRVRVARPGFTAIQVEFNDTQATMSVAGQKFGTGCIPSGGVVDNGGAFTSLLMQRTNADTEGSTKMATAFAALGAE